MAISFIPNDPRAVSQMPLRKQAARPDRPASRARFALAGAPAEGQYEVGTAEFLWWQCREAALTATEMWEAVTGTPLTKWARHPKGKPLPLRLDEGEELNAYYDGASLLFFHHPVGSKTMWTGASTDVVSHECGHAFLDILRPDLFNANYIEPASFHEAFGDCIALLTALYDKASRVKLLAVAPTLRKANFVEALMEDLANGFRVNEGKDFAASAPRHCYNKFQWALPETLKPNAPPAVLTREEHSFGRVFAGCFYDLVRLIRDESGSTTEAGLWKAAAIAGRLLHEGAKNAPITPRFFQAVGRAMALADQSLHGGKHADLVVEAFRLHNIVVSASAVGAPKAALKGAAPKRLSATTLSLSKATMQDLRARFGAVRPSSVESRTIRLGTDVVGAVVHRRPVQLDSFGARFKGVVAIGHEATMVGASNRRAALVSTFPDPSITNDEVHAYVQTLLANNRIQANGAAMKSAATKAAHAPLGTHRIVKQGDSAVLERVRFSCGCGCKPRLATPPKNVCAEE